MERREFITLLGGAAVTWPFAARALPAREKIAIDRSLIRQLVVAGAH